MAGRGRVRGALVESQGCHRRGETVGGSTILPMRCGGGEGKEEVLVAGRGQWGFAGASPLSLGLRSGHAEVGGEGAPRSLWQGAGGVRGWGGALDGGVPGMSPTRRGGGGARRWAVTTIFPMRCGGGRARRRSLWQGAGSGACVAGGAPRWVGRARRGPCGRAREGARLGVERWMVESQGCRRRGEGGARNGGRGVRYYLCIAAGGGQGGGPCGRAQAVGLASPGLPLSLSAVAGGAPRWEGRAAVREEEEQGNIVARGRAGGRRVTVGHYLRRYEHRGYS